jgi:hypothetical protein
LILVGGEKQEDLMAKRIVSDRPQKVVLAVNMFYIIVGIGITRAAMTIFRHADVRSPYFLIISKIIVYIGSIFLIYQLSKGKNWARFSMVAIFIICIPLAILPTFASFSFNPVHSILGFIQILLYITGLALLFKKSSSHWFRSEDVHN